MNEDTRNLVLERLENIKLELDALSKIVKEKDNDLLYEYLGEVMKIVYASQFIVERDIHKGDHKVYGRTLKKIITIKDVKRPTYWVKVARSFINTPTELLKDRHSAATLAYHIHIGVSQYLELYFMLQGGSVEIDIDKNNLIEVLENCIKIDNSFQEIKKDCDIVAPYALEVTYPDSIEVTVKETKKVMKAGLRIEKFMLSKIILPTEQ